MILNAFLFHYIRHTYYIFSILFSKVHLFQVRLRVESTENIILSVLTKCFETLFIE